MAKQLEIFYRVAEYMHSKGMNVYVRESLGGPLARFTAPGTD